MSPRHSALDTTFDINSPHNNLKNFTVASAVARGELSLSLSSMLGCDYIFVSYQDLRNQGMHPLLQPQNAGRTIRELLDLLDTPPHQSMVIAVEQTLDADTLFTRYDYIWENRQVAKVSLTAVTHSEQVDFMRMMFECSTAC